MRALRYAWDEALASLWRGRQSGVLSTATIAVALFVAALIGSAQLPLSVKVNIGLAFEVAASYGIAAAEFLDPSSLAVKGSWTGLSWVAVWTALFTVVVPTRPRRANAAPSSSTARRSFSGMLVGPGIKIGFWVDMMGSPKPRRQARRARRLR